MLIYFLSFFPKWRVRRGTPLRREIHGQDVRCQIRQHTGAQGQECDTQRGQHYEPPASPEIAQFA